MRYVLGLSGGLVFASMFWNILWSTYQTAKDSDGKYGESRRLIIICGTIAMFFAGVFLTDELTASLQINSP